jgi:hypothetical protein
MQKLTMVTISCLLILTQIPNVFANSGNISNGIERIEMKDGMKIVYYKNGLREVFVSFSGSVNVDTSVETTTQVIHTPIHPIEPFPIDKILRIIKQVLDTISSYGVGCSLLAWMIWNTIKRLRHDRPRDYRGVAW